MNLKVLLHIYTQIQITQRMLPASNSRIKVSNHLIYYINSVFFVVHSVTSFSENSVQIVYLILTEPYFLHYWNSSW